jgi:hypothetical protein
VATTMMVMVDAHACCLLGGKEGHVCTT